MRKEFNLEEWKNNPEKYLLNTREGMKVRILATDINDPMYPICAAIMYNDGFEYPGMYTKSGRFYEGMNDKLDLIMTDGEGYEKPDENERQFPLWIRGCEGNPDGVILAMMTEFPNCGWMSADLFDENSGLRDNAGNPECIFYYSERLAGDDRVRLLDGCNTLEKEWIATSSAWREIKPSDAETMKELKEINDKYKKIFPEGFFGKYSGK